MAERKALVHYYPPDFDPSKIKRVKRPVDRQQVVRLMAPFSMGCKTCGEYIYKGRKFNARKELAVGEDYFGIKIFRFYIKCTRCSAEITFKTDPKNTDYTIEHGATRNFDPYRPTPREDNDDPLAHFVEADRLKALEEQGKGHDPLSSSSRRQLEESDDPMATLEARQEESRREMEEMDALQDLRTRNARLDRVDAGDVLERLESRRNAEAAASLEEQERRLAEEEDEALVRKYFSNAEDLLGGAEEQRELDKALRGEDDELTTLDGSALPAPSAISNSSPAPSRPSHTVKRLQTNGDVEPDAKSLLSERARSLLSSSSTSTSTSTSTPTRNGHTPASLSSASALPPKKKAKNGSPANPFGLVKKKK